MHKVIRNFLWAFWYDDMAFKRWMRSLTAAATTVALQLTIDPAWTTWTFKQWLVKSIPVVLTVAHASQLSSATAPPADFMPPPKPNV